MSGLTCSKKMTVKTMLASAVALLATGFLFAAGYDIYTRLFKKSQ